MAGELPQAVRPLSAHRKLGEGGMGVVYLAHDTRIGPPGGDQDAQVLPAARIRSLIERFYREARAAAKLQHRNICPVYDVGEIDGVHYISMAYIEGRPLSVYIAVRHAINRNVGGPGGPQGCVGLAGSPRARRGPSRPEAGQHHDRPASGSR